MKTHRRGVGLHLDRGESHERIVAAVRDVGVRVERAGHRELHVALTSAEPARVEQKKTKHVVSIVPIARTEIK